MTNEKGKYYRFYVQMCEYADLQMIYEERMTLLNLLASSAHLESAHLHIMNDIMEAGRIQFQGLRRNREE